MREPSTDDRLGRPLTGEAARLPFDAAAVGGFVLLANGVLLAPLDPGPAVSALFGLPLLFFLPGYAVVSVLFPAAAPSRNRRSSDAAGIDVRERLALSVGASVGLLPVVALALSLIGVGYERGIVAAALGGVAVLAMALGVVRRRQLPAYMRFRVPYDDWLATVDDGLSAGSRVDVAVNVVLALAVMGSVLGVGYVAAAPNNAETFTSVTVLSENEGGDLVAGGYPDPLAADGSEFVLRVRNAEGENAEYTVVGELQRVEPTSGAQRVVERQEVLRTSATVERGESWVRSNDVRPELSGEELRLIYHVYRGDAPAEPSTDTAYRYAHVWVDAGTDVTG